MSVLLIAEHNNAKLKPFTLNAITAASKMDADVHVLIAGTNCENVAKEIASIPLVKKVLVCDSPNYQNYLPSLNKQVKQLKDNFFGCSNMIKVLK